MSEKQIDLLLVNPPMLRERPEIFGDVGTLFVPGDIKVEAMNPGVLSICTFLKSRGWRVEICDLLLAEDFRSLREAIQLLKPRVIGVSSSCAFDYIDALKCLEIAKEEAPEVITVLGGQQAGPLGELVFDDTSSLDYLCFYEGEHFMENLLMQLKDGRAVKLSGSISCVSGELVVNRDYPMFVSLDSLPPLDYKSYPNYQYYTPFIEESRGCSFGCGFCTSKLMNRQRIRIKSPECVNRDVKHMVKCYGTDRVAAILASTFGARRDYAKAVVDIFARNSIRWTTEIRADGPWEDYLDTATKNGLTVLNVGVESFCEEILLIMGKTKSPKKYLERVASLSSFFANQSDSILRTNMMLYVGETPRTIRESLSFLAHNGGGIKSMLCSTVFAVNGTSLFRNFEPLASRFGCKMVSTPYWEKVHVYPCKLSHYFSFEETCNLAKVIEKMYSTEEGWYQSEMYHYSQKDQDTIEERQKSLLKGRFISE